jgi:hypothetical protein
MGFVCGQELALDQMAFLVVLTPFGRISAIVKVMHAARAGANSFRVGVRLDVVPPTDRSAWASLVARGSR